MDVLSIKVPKIISKNIMTDVPCPPSSPLPFSEIRDGLGASRVGRASIWIATLRSSDTHATGYARVTLYWRRHSRVQPNLDAKTDSALHATTTILRSPPFRQLPRRERITTGFVLLRTVRLCWSLIFTIRVALRIFFTRAA